MMYIPDALLQINYHIGELIDKLASNIKIDDLSSRHKVSLLIEYYKKFHLKQQKEYDKILKFYQDLIVKVDDLGKELSCDVARLKKFINKNIDEVNFLHNLQCQTKQLLSKYDGVSNNELSNLSKNLYALACNDPSIRFWIIDCKTTIPVALSIQALKYNNFITGLEVYCNALDNNSLTILENILCNNSSIITLSIKDINSNNLKFAINIINKNSRVKNLTLAFDEREIEVAALYELAKSLAKNTTIEVLSVSLNPACGSNLAAALSTTLRTNNILRYLDLSGCGIDMFGAFYLSGALEVNQTLRILMLPGNDIGNEGIKALSQALIKNNSLRHIDLESARVLIDDTTANSLSNLFACNTALVSVSLVAQGLTTAHAKSFYQALSAKKANRKETSKLCYLGATSWETTYTAPEWQQLKELLERREELLSRVARNEIALDDYYILEHGYNDYECYDYVKFTNYYNKALLQADASEDGTEDVNVVLGAGSIDRAIIAQSLDNLDYQTNLQYYKWIANYLKLQLTAQAFGNMLVDKAGLVCKILKFTPWFNKLRAIDARYVVFAQEEENSAIINTLVAREAFGLSVSEPQTKPEILLPFTKGVCKGELLSHKDKYMISITATLSPTMVMKITAFVKIIYHQMPCINSAKLLQLSVHIAAVMIQKLFPQNSDDATHSSNKLEFTLEPQMLTDMCDEPTKVISTVTAIYEIPSIFISLTSQMTYHIYDRLVHHKRALLIDNELPCELSDSMLLAINRQLFALHNVTNNMVLHFNHKSKLEKQHYNNTVHEINKNKRAKI